MHIDYRFLKNFLLLQRCYKTYKSRYQVSRIFSIISNLVTIIAFAISLEINILKSDSLF